MEQIETFIRKHGGAKAIADKLEMSPGAVRMWKMRKRIPRTVWPDLIDKLPTSLKALRETEAA